METLGLSSGCGSRGSSVSRLCKATEPVLHQQAQGRHPVASLALGRWSVLWNIFILCLAWRLTRAPQEWTHEFIKKFQGSLFPSYLAVYSLPRVLFPFGFPDPVSQGCWGLTLLLCLFPVPILFQKDFIYLERGREGEKEGEKHQCVVALTRPLLGAWPATQAHALSGNGTGDPLVCRPALNHWATPARAGASMFLM